MGEITLTQIFKHDFDGLLDDIWNKKVNLNILEPVYPDHPQYGSFIKNTIISTPKQLASDVRFDDRDWWIRMDGTLSAESLEKSSIDGLVKIRVYSISLKEWLYHQPYDIVKGIAERAFGQHSHNIDGSYHWLVNYKKILEFYHRIYSSVVY